MKLHQGCDFKPQEPGNTEDWKKKIEKKNKREKRRKIKNKLCPSPVESHL